MNLEELANKYNLDYEKKKYLELSIKYFVELKKTLSGYFLERLNRYDNNYFALGISVNIKPDELFTGMIKDIEKYATKKTLINKYRLN